VKLLLCCVNDLSSISQRIQVVSVDKQRRGRCLANHGREILVSRRPTQTTTVLFPGRRCPGKNRQPAALLFYTTRKTDSPQPVAQERYHDARQTQTLGSSFRLAGRRNRPHAARGSFPPSVWVRVGLWLIQFRLSADVCVRLRLIKSFWQGFAKVRKLEGRVHMCYGLPEVF